MSIIYKRSAVELITGTLYNTLRFHLKPTRIGRCFGYQPVTREYLTNGGFWWFDSQGGKIDNAATWNRLTSIYQSEKMRLAIESNRPLNVTVIDTGKCPWNSVAGQTNPGPEWEIIDDPKLGGRIYVKKETDPVTPA